MHLESTENIPNLHNKKTCNSRETGSSQLNSSFAFILLELWLWYVYITGQLLSSEGEMAHEMCVYVFKGLKMP